VDEKGSTLKADNDKLSHIDENGKAQMVDVGNKEDTKRSATASGKVFMSVETIEALKKQNFKKETFWGSQELLEYRLLKRHLT